MVPLLSRGSGGDRGGGGGGPAYVACQEAVRVCREVPPTVHLRICVCAINSTASTFASPPPPGRGPRPASWLARPKGKHARRNQSPDTQTAPRRPLSGPRSTLPPSRAGDPPPIPLRSTALLQPSLLLSKPPAVAPRQKLFFSFPVVTAPPQSAGTDSGVRWRPRR